MNFLKRDFIIREPLLVGILVLITIVFSALTHSYSQAYDRRRTALGIEWSERGNEELKNHHPAAAVDAFRTALFYDPRNSGFSMHLADALTEADHPEQALTYYLSLWQSTPNNGPVNLQLARLYSRKGDVAGAERYFNGAVYSDWPENAADNRREASLELIHFYLDRQDTGHAESQLILLSGNLPEDPALHTQVAGLYSRVGDDQRALAQYRQAIQLRPDYAPAIQGAAEAAFHLGDYRSAQSYATHSLQLDDSSAPTKNLLAILQSLSLLNPYERGISEAEKIIRTLRLFRVAGIRLESCAHASHSSAAIGPSLERWKQLQAIANTRFLSEHPEETETLIEFSTSAEKSAAPYCGEPTPDDSAVLAIARGREKEAR